MRPTGRGPPAPTSRPLRRPSPPRPARRRRAPIVLGHPDAGVDMIAAARADVDSTKMGVTGGSYGGFMTAWITTRTNRFKAAEANRMISNWWSWVALYDSLSPIRHVNQVKTPTLIVQSEEDHRTPMADAEQWFMALQKQKVPVEFIRYPRSTHDLSRTGEPWLLVDRLGRLRQWFDHWLR